MNNSINGDKEKAFAYFSELVAMSLKKSGYFLDLDSGREFAKSLDWSFEELYENIPRELWVREVAVDCEEFLKSVHWGGQA